jgi:electron transfer flavoprotein beta subunit
MRIVVCIKQIPDPEKVRLSSRTGALVREGVPDIVNPEDKNAIEEALKLRDAGLDVEIVALSMGPPEAATALREALAMGADRAILLSDAAFTDADAMATANALGLAVKHLGDYDLVLCGRQAIDDNAAQVGPQLAEYLHIPQITEVRELAIDDGKVRAKRMLEDGYEEIETPLPALLTILSQANTPRHPRAASIFRVHRQEVTVWGAKDVNADEEEVGAKGSPTQVKRMFAPEPKAAGEMLAGSEEEMVKALVRRLRSRNLI